LFCPRFPACCPAGRSSIYVEDGSTFIAEHGGDASAGRNVPLLVCDAWFGPIQSKVPVRTSQIAPSIRKELGLEPESLGAVRTERTPLLPGLDFARMSQSSAP